MGWIIIIHNMIQESCTAGDQRLPFLQGCLSLVLLLGLAALAVPSLPALDHITATNKTFSSESELFVAFVGEYYEKFHSDKPK